MPNETHLTQEKQTSASIRAWLKNNLGIKLPHDLHIHHIDHNRAHNALSNLIGITAREHRLAHSYHAPKTPTAFKKWLGRLRKNMPVIGQCYKMMVRNAKMTLPCKGCPVSFKEGDYKVWTHDGNYHEACWERRQAAIL